MRIFTVSDIHIDHRENKRWIYGLSQSDYQDDILILAGDVTDNIIQLRQCFSFLSSIFYKVMFVPGNHELWTVRDSIKSSFKKLELITELISDHDILMKPCRFETVSIIPLFAWYDYSFGEPDEKIKMLWADYRNCSWPENYEDEDITKYFLNKNVSALTETNNEIISFSHFLPSLNVIPESVPATYHYIFPVLGSEMLGNQVEKLNPTMHIYGHSHINRDITIGGIRYINNAFGSPAENWTRKKMLCVYEN